mmetsp:Transcript_34730/g.42701  ORF Transcript_34730/g.42701 Transcript_34730/m.42701 type:complete len:203 (-) Transcript_34730:108-716(-)
MMLRTCYVITFKCANRHNRHILVANLLYKALHGLFHCKVFHIGYYLSYVLIKLNIYCDNKLLDTHGLGANSKFFGPLHLIFKLSSLLERVFFLLFFQGPPFGAVIIHNEDGGISLTQTAHLSLVKFNISRGVNQHENSALVHLVKFLEFKYLSHVPLNLVSSGGVAQPSVSLILSPTISFSCIVLHLCEAFGALKLRVFTRQ